MYRESIRDMNERERQELVESLQCASPVSARQTLKWAGLWFGAMVVLAIVGAGLFGLIVIGSFPILAGLLEGVAILAWIVSLFGFIAVVSGHFRWRWYARKFHRDDAPRIRAALEHGKVLSKQVAARSVVVIEEYEDEGNGYIFDLGEGRSLLLKGQQYFPIDHKMPWPASRLEIVRSADAGIWIGIFSSGESLTPCRTLKTEDCNDDFIWAEMEEVVQGEPDDVLAKILKASK
jgi:hypothetical protein